MREVLSLAAKDLRLMLRDRAGFFFTFFFPILYATFFGAIFSGAGGSGTGALRIAVVDEDHSETTRKFLDALDQTAEVELLRETGELPRPLTRDDAANMVRRGRAVAYLVMAEGMGERLNRPFWGEPLRLDVGLDPARQAEAGFLQGILTRAAFEQMGSIFSDREKMKAYVATSLKELETAENTDPMLKGALSLFLPALATLVDTLPAGGEGFAGFQPVELATTDVARVWEGPKNSYEISFPQAVLWGMLGCAAGFGISLVTERTQGTLVRLRMAPIAPIQVLCGKAVACFATTSAVAVVLLGLAMVVFGVRPGSFPLLAVAIVASSLAFVGIMMFLSVLGKTEQGAAGVGWAILMVMAMTGGGMVPLFAMPGWMRTISDFSPVKWCIYVIEGAIWRGFSPAEMLFPCALLLAIGAGCFLIGVRAFSWTQRT